MSSEVSRPPRPTRPRTGPAAEPTPTARGGSQRSGRTGSSGKVPATPTAPEPAPNSWPILFNPDALPGEQTPGEPTFKLTVQIPQSLRERAAGLVAYADMHGQPPEVNSMTALVRIALVEKIAAYEGRYNVGLAFPTPHRIRRGRTPMR